MHKQQSHSVVGLWTVALRTAVCLALTGGAWAAQPASISVQVDKPGHAVAPTLWGIFFEDINCSADGGIYAELVRNRSLEDSDKPEHWSVVTGGSGRGEMAVTTEAPMQPDQGAGRNLRSLRLNVTQADAANPVGVANDGFWGIAVKQGASYQLTLYARGSDGYTGPLLISLEDKAGKSYAQGELTGLMYNLETAQALPYLQRHRSQGTPRYSRPSARHHLA